MREAGSTGARLLVADDNKVNRLLLTRNLELQGHSVASASNGRVALEMRSSSLRLWKASITSCAASNWVPRVTCKSRSTRCC